MTDLANDIANETIDAPSIAGDPSTIMAIPVTKGGATVDVDVSKLPDDVYREALLQGLKVLANREMSKITKENIPNEAERKSEAMVKAEANVQKMYEGKIKITGKKSTAKVSGAVMTEARRLAKNLIKDAMKAQGIKISHVKSSEITSAANALLDSDPSLIAQAEANLADREKVQVKIDIKSLIKTDPKLVAAAEEKKAKDKANRTLSKTQAGKTAPRAKAKGGQQASV